MIIVVNGVSYETENIKDADKRKQVQAYVSQMAFNNQMQISIQKSNDKLQGELNELLPEEAVVENEVNDSEKTEKSKK
tara:strand:+ start:1445 stop:1678 length:234 start_codon:yes stop_codon:yes gene_type:complete